jgi:hypothetical protein
VRPFSEEEKDPFKGVTMKRYCGVSILLTHFLSTWKNPIIQTWHLDYPQHRLQNPKDRHMPYMTSERIEAISPFYPIKWENCTGGISAEGLGANIDTLKKILSIIIIFLWCLVWSIGQKSLFSILFGLSPNLVGLVFSG